MNDRVKNELNNIVNTLAGTGIVSQIFLFGSYARGEETPDSDVDLCVLTPVKDKLPIDISVGFLSKLRGVRTMPLDMLTYEKENFYDSAKRSTSLQHEIAENGVLLYDHV